MGNIFIDGDHMIMDQVHTAGVITERVGSKAANNFALTNGAKTYAVKSVAMDAKG